MMRNEIPFLAALTKMETKAKKTGTIQTLILKHEATGDLQSFLDSYSDRCENSGQISGLFLPEVAWKSLVLEAAYRVKVTLDSGPSEYTFEANLAEIKVARIYKNGFERFTYQLRLEKELEPEMDPTLAHFVNAKDMNPVTGKVEALTWPIAMEPLEPMAQSVNTETGGASDGPRELGQGGKFGDYA